MKSRQLLGIIMIFTLMGIISISTTALAQDSETCQALVNTALNQLGTNCANLERNTSCYGFDDVEHTAFAEDVPADFYSQPGDRSDLTITEAVQTGPIDVTNQMWGLNVMNVEGSLPNALPGKGVVYIQTGGVEVENGVDPNAAVELGDGVSVSTVSSTDLLTWPAPSVTGHASETILSIPTGASLVADALDPSGEFARVVYQNSYGWVSISALDSSVDLSDLPAIGPDDMTPMQDFYFRVGIGGTPCAEAPSLLFVQTPTGVPTDITVFGTHFRVQGTVVFRSLPPGDQLGNTIEILVVSGLATINPDSGSEIIVPPGFKSSVGLCDEFSSLGIEGDADERAVCTSWSQPVPMTEGDLDDVSIVEDFPSNLTNSSVDVPVIVQASGAGGATPQLTFPNQQALDEARAACLAGELSGDVCAYLGIS